MTTGEGGEENRRALDGHEEDRGFLVMTLGGKIGGKGWCLLGLYIYFHS